jgi:hypothetical protein
MASERRSRSKAGWILTLAVAIAGPGCGGFVESGDDVQRLTVGEEGGTLAMGEFALVVPPYALAHTVTLSAHREETDAPAGPAFTVGSTAHVTFPSVAANVTLHYDAAVHTHPAEMFVAILVSNVWHPLDAPAAGSHTPGVAQGETTEIGTFGVIECPGGVCP